MKTDRIGRYVVRHLVISVCSAGVVALAGLTVASLTSLDQLLASLAPAGVVFAGYWATRLTKLRAALLAASDAPDEADIADDLTGG